MRYALQLSAVATAALVFACGDATELDQPYAEGSEESAESLEQSLATPNPGERGPHAVTSVTYGSDTQRSTLNGILTEHLGHIHYPSDMQNGPYPLVLILHGDHDTCETFTGGDVNAQWPCPGGTRPVASYRGYDYLADTLASHGMVVASISANGMNAPADNVSVPRELLIRNHMNQFDHFNAFGEDAFNAFPGADAFEGMVDMDNVALVGHSKGGGAVLSFTHVVDNPSGTVRAIVPIAPTGSQFVNNIPVALVHGYCDGDVDNPPFEPFDNARYAVPNDETEKYSFIPMGANHNFFNDLWSPGPSDPATPHTFDDANVRFGGDPHCDARESGNGRLTKDQQQAIAKVWISAFLRRHLNGETEFDAALKGEVTPIPAALNEDVKIGFHAGASDRRDINRMNDEGLFEQGRNDLPDGTFELSGFSSSEVCKANRCEPEGLDGHKHDVVHLTWNESGASFENRIPSSSGDVRQFNAVQFRVGVTHSDGNNPSEPDFRVVLRDNRGRTASVLASDFTNGLEVPPGLERNRKVIMTTVRVPLSAFSRVSTRRIRSVELVFDQTDAGSLLFSDLAFSR